MKGVRYSDHTHLINAVLDALAALSKRRDYQPKVISVGVITESKPSPDILFYLKEFKRTIYFTYVECEGGRVSIDQFQKIVKCYALENGEKEIVKPILASRGIPASIDNARKAYLLIFGEKDSRDCKDVLAELIKDEDVMKMEKNVCVLKISFKKGKNKGSLGLIDEEKSRWFAKGSTGEHIVRLFWDVWKENNFKVLQRIYYTPEDDIRIIAPHLFVTLIKLACEKAVGDERHDEMEINVEDLLEKMLRNSFTPEFLGETLNMGTDQNKGRRISVYHKKARERMKSAIVHILQRFDGYQGEKERTKYLELRGSKSNFSVVFLFDPTDTQKLKGFKNVSTRFIESEYAAFAPLPIASQQES